MLKNIEGASHFIYIEGQFFQSAHGSTMIGNEEADGGAPVSGPMHALMDLKGSPGYQKYAAQLGILGVPPAQIYKSLKWSQIDDVQRDVRGGGADFNERFWRRPQPCDEGFTWDANKLLSEKTPIGIFGFITAFPILWTLGENNDSKMNLTTLANADPQAEGGKAQQTAALPSSGSERVSV
ncbi:hypothetical protein [Cupriavidus nantongensis]